MRRRATEREPAPAPPAALELRLADGTPAEAFERLARAIDSRVVTIHEAELLSRVMERRLHVLDAERFRQRLELAEAAAREAQRRVAVLPPARAVVVDVGLAGAGASAPANGARP